MTTTELNELIITKVGVKPWKRYNESFALRFRHRGNVYRCSTDIFVEKVDGACLVTDSDARQLEKLLRGEQWDGTGLPTVGTECEYEDNTGNWIHVEVVYKSDWVIVIRGKENNLGNGVEIAKDLVMDKLCRFRPLRTERDKTIDQMIKVFSSNAAPGTTHALVAIYDAIVAGKIDGLGKVG